MKLIVGLGNPGPEYAKTRHNVGFMALDRFAVRHHITGPRTRFHAGVLEGPVAGDKCVLMQPTTYMNRSGLAVGEAVSFYKLDLADVLVVVDDIYLPCGRIRLRPDGSAAGHNGLTDIERALGTSDYPRLRIGVDPPGRVPQADYVLGKFTGQQWPLVDAALDRAVDAIACWVTDGITKAMTNYNSSE